MEKQEATCEMTRGEKVMIALLQGVAVFCFVELVITIIQCYA
jgi:hypothetical protein